MSPIGSLRSCEHATSVWPSRPHIVRHCDCNGAMLDVLVRADALDASAAADSMGAAAVRSPSPSHPRAHSLRPTQAQCDQVVSIGLPLYPFYSLLMNVEPRRARRS